LVSRRIALLDLRASARAHVALEKRERADKLRGVVFEDDLDRGTEHVQMNFKEAAGALRSLARV
jgi:hypothetical protein